MEELEVCSLPGGLARVRKQFETQEIANSHNVTQFQFHHRTVQVHMEEYYTGCLSGYEHDREDRGQMMEAFPLRWACFSLHFYIELSTCSMALHGELYK